MEFMNIIEDKCIEPAEAPEDDESLGCTVLAASTTGHINLYVSSYGAMFKYAEINIG
jgi:hypothetical protein